MSAYDTIVDQLWERLPWLSQEPEYGDLSDQWSDAKPGPHIAYGDVLVPVVARMLQESPTNERHLDEAFALVEEMANSPDEKISEVAVVTVLEGLHGIPEVREAAWRRMGPVSRHYTKSIAEAWGQ